MISKISLGTMRMPLSDKELIFGILDKAYDEGINFFDTADMYGRGFANNPRDPYDGSGKHTELLGKWLEKSGGRDEIILSTKVRWPLKLAPNNEGLSRNHIIKSLTESLKSLKTNYIDILFLHGDANNVNLFDVMKTMDSLQSDFKLNYLGTSNMNAYRIMEANMISKYNGLIGISALQTKYSLLDREVFEREHQHLAKDLDLAVLAYGILSEGFLSGLYQQNHELPNKQGAEEVFKSNNNPRSWKIIETLNEISQEQGMSQDQIALAWINHKHVIDTPLIGVSSIQQLENSLGALDITLTQDQVNRLDEVSMQHYPWWSNMDSRNYLNTYEKLIEKYQSN